MTKRFLKKFWPGLVITLVIFAFRIRLFSPHLSIYVTPDYGRSDAISLSLANKFYYAQELKKTVYPFGIRISVQDIQPSLRAKQEFSSYQI